MFISSTVNYFLDPKSMSLKNKTALITGASSGIGEACAYALKEEGARLILTGRNKIKLEELAKKMDASFVVADLQDNSEIEKLFNEAGTSIDILVNNAGIAPSASIIDGDISSFKDLLEVNVLALTHCCQLALKKFDSISGGQIVNISSMSGHRVPPSGGFYAATKFAVRAVTEALRFELKAQNNKTRVTMISPGFVDTPLLEKYFSSDQEKLKKLRLELKMLDPNDIAETLKFILKTPKHVEIGDILLRPQDQKI